MKTSILKRMSSRCKAFTGAFVGALMLAASLCAGSAYASIDSTTVTVGGITRGDTLYAFQISQATVDENNNLTYDESVVATFPQPYNTIAKIDAIATDGQKYSPTYVKGSDMQAAAAAMAGKLLENGTAGAIDSAVAGFDGKASVELEPGYYLLITTGTGGTTRVYQNMVIDCSPVARPDGAYAPCPDFGFTVKSSDVTLSKVAGENYAESTDAYTVGNIVPFTITTAIPNYPSDSTNATFVVGDTMGTGLSFNTSSIVVTVEGVPTTLADMKVSTTDTGFTVEFYKDFILAHPGAAVSVTYSATLTSEAFSLDSGDVTRNSATVTFNPSPYVQGSYSSTPEVVVVQTYGVVVKKVDESGAILSGATFKIKDAQGAYVKDENGVDLTSTSDANGYVYFSALGAGRYTLVETGVPAGYVACGPIAITLSEAACTADNPATAEVENNYLDKTDTPIIDGTQPSLPVTGGVGTIALSLVGALLIAGAARGLMRNRQSER